MCDVLLSLSRRYSPPSTIVLAKLGQPDQMFLAFCVDAAPESSETQFHFDKYGHFTNMMPQQSQRIARIGWAFGSGGHIKGSKERIMEAEEETQTVLNEFLADVLEVSMRGGRLLSENVAFHGALVEQELLRCSMTALHKHWGIVMNEALSLNDPALGKWVQENYDRELTQKPSDQTLPNLRSMLRFILPECVAAYPPRGYSTMEKSGLYLKAVRSLYELSVPPCQRPGGRHNFKKVFDCCMRDNGEYSEVCTDCGHTL